MQVLYQLEVGKVDIEEAFSYLRENFAPAEKDLEFARHLVNGTVENLAALDETIARYSDDWQLKRIAVVDRNILRLALYEIMYEGTPLGVSINEAVEMAKLYGGEKSGRFINGILSAVSKKSKPANIKESSQDSNQESNVESTQEPG